MSKISKWLQCITFIYIPYHKTIPQNGFKSFDTHTHTKKVFGFNFKSFCCHLTSENDASDMEFYHNFHPPWSRTEFSHRSCPTTGYR